MGKKARQQGAIRQAARERSAGQARIPTPIWEGGYGCAKDVLAGDGATVWRTHEGHAAPVSDASGLLASPPDSDSGRAVASSGGNTLITQMPTASHNSRPPIKAHTFDFPPVARFFPAPFFRLRPPRPYCGLGSAWAPWPESCLATLPSATPSLF